MKVLTIIGTAAIVTAAAPASADVFVLNYEASGVEHTTASFTTVGVETFDSPRQRDRVHHRLRHRRRDHRELWPGAGQQRRPIWRGRRQREVRRRLQQHALFAEVRRRSGAAAARGQLLRLLAVGARRRQPRRLLPERRQVGALSPGDVLARIGDNRNYFGNPDAPFKGRDRGEPFAFINFYDTTGSFDEVRFTQTTGGGYESDNHTVGFYTATGGVPEAGTWAMMMVGFGLMGSRLRRREVTYRAA